MTAVAERPEIEEAREFLERHPELHTVDLLLTDTHGVIRGKRIVKDQLLKVYLNGVNLPGSVFGLDISGATVESTGLGLRSGDPDRLCRPVPGSLFVVPWSEPPRAQATLSMYDADGRPFFADPRHLLSRVVNRFSAEALRPDVAVELEFYFCTVSGGRPGAPLWPGRDRPDQSTQCYGVEQLDDCGECIDEILAAGERQRIAAESAISEYAPGQYEINLDHGPDPLRACDEAVRLKRIVKGVAARHGLQATFMAKPYPELAGNGQHVHVSVLDQGGANLFSGEAERPNPALRRALAGLQGSCSDFMAVFAPNANSYRRFAPGNYAPTSSCWGVNNRSVALRVPLGGAASRRIEHRVAGGDANPYLVMAAVLAGLHHGLGEARTLEPPVVGNAYDLCQPNLPDTWIGALFAFQESALAEAYFGAEYCRLFTSLKLAEREQFNRQVTDLEYAWYLRTA